MFDVKLFVFLTGRKTTNFDNKYVDHLCKFYFCLIFQLRRTIEICVLRFLFLSPQACNFRDNINTFSKSTYSGDILIEISSTQNALLMLCFVIKPSTMVAMVKKVTM